MNFTIVSSSSNISGPVNNQLVLITNNFCSNFPIIKPVEEVSLKERSLAEMGYDANIVPNWVNISQPKKPDMQTLLINRIKNYEKTDVEIRIDDSKFRCHMIVLQCYSDYFANITDQSKFVVLPSENVTPHAFYMIYQWMLSANPTIGRRGIVEFFKGAQFLQIESASTQCWACICDSRIVEDAAFLLYMEARQMGLTDVQKAMSDRICKFFLMLVASKEYLELNVEEVIIFLSSNSVGVHSEMEVILMLNHEISTYDSFIQIFLSALRWLYFDWESRSEYSLRLMECVRFGHMTQSQLVLLKQQNHKHQEREIRNVVNDTVRKWIDDAIRL